MADNLTITQGTQSIVAADDVSSVYYPRFKLDIGADGAASPFTGTVPEVTGLKSGTVTVVGNVNTGTISTVGLVHPDSFGSIGTISSTSTGTVHAAVAGSVIYITDVVISTDTASSITVSSGTSTVPLLGPLHLAANGGMVGNFVTPLETASGSAVVYDQTGAGTMSVLVKGYID